MSTFNGDPAWDQCQRDNAQETIAALRQRVAELEREAQHLRSESARASIERRTVSEILAGAYVSGLPDEADYETPLTEQAMATLNKLAAAEADAKEWQARAMGLVFHVPADKMLGDIQDARQRWIDAEADAARWHDGVPPKPFDSEWFIAELKSGDRAVLRALPEEYAYDYKTADESYLKKTLVVRWMQFPDSQFVRFAAPQPHAGGSEGL